MLDEAKQICPTTTRRRISEGAILVDVRQPEEVAHLAFDVPELIHIPLSELETRFPKLPRDRDLVMVCQDGGRSLKATYFLMYQGFKEVANMEGGIAKWARKGFPVHGDASPSRSADHTTSGCCGPSSEAVASCCEPDAAGPGSCC